MDFDNKLKSLDKTVTSNKTKHVLVKNELNKLRKEVAAITARGLTKDLLNKSILNAGKYFKIIWYLYQIKNIANILIALLKFICGNLMECQKKVLKI